MKARITKIGKTNVEVLLENTKTKIVPKDKLRFDYDVGDTIVIRKNGSKNTYVALKPSSKSKKRKITYIIASALLLGTTLVTAILNWPKEPQPATRQQLEACLQAVTSASIEEKSVEQQRCYSDYPVEESAEKIDELDKKIAETRLTQCKIKAWNSYPAQEELDAARAADDLNMLKDILTRRIQAIETEISCYKTYSKNDEEALAKLYESKAKNEELLAMANNYQEYTPTYTYETPTYESPADYNYYAPTPEETAPQTPTLTCDDYHSQYYADYSSQKSSITREYNSSISNASMQCASRGQSGCPAVTSLERERDREIAHLKNSYKDSMQSVGCDPSSYVDF